MNGTYKIKTVGLLALLLMLVPGPNVYAEGYIAINGELQAVGCTVNGDGNIDVPLDGVKLNTLNQKGAVVGKTLFTIGLNCYSNTQVNISLSSSHQDSYGTGVLSNTTGDGQSSGIGIQVLDQNSAPVTLGKSFTVINSATDGSNSIQLYAQYIRTGDSASAGSIKTDADYTLSYN